MKLQDKLRELDNQNDALLAINFYNYETLSAVVKAAKKADRSIILQASESTIKYLGLNSTSALARSVLKQEEVEGWLHLDHAKDVDLIRSCLDAGFDSVMIDASGYPFDENVKRTSEVVEIAKSYAANVEAELGYIAKLGQSQEKLSYTQPDEANEFVERTGIDALAVAIGSSHGFYKQAPELQIELLEKIYKGTPAYLVLHGSSGIPDEQIQSAVKHGIRKINLATEIKDTFMNTLKEVLQQTDEIDLRKVFPKAMESVVDLVLSKYGVLDKVNL